MVSSFSLTSYTPQSLFILNDRYFKKDENGNSLENPEQLWRRVAKAIAKGEKTEAEQQHWEEEFFFLLSQLLFLPNSPTIANAGLARGCLSACFVYSPEDTMDSILQTQYKWGMIEKWGGGVGIGLSNIRPTGDRISTTHGKALGPISVLEMLSLNSSKITQGSFRQGAHMAQLICTHPDLQEFIHCKDDDKAIQNFNISVQITDDFMKAVENDKDWKLINPKNGDLVKVLPAKQIWEEIAESAWKTGDPGVVFIDRVWETAPNPQLGKILTSNPCGEEFLENGSNCCLGSIDLGKHILADSSNFDQSLLEKTVRTAVRFLDDVIEVNTFPLPELREMNLKTRRIGLGVMGFSDLLLLLRIPYDSEDAISKAREIGSFIKKIAWDESEKLADERGTFLEYENSQLKKIDMPPVRHSSVTTIAPTGTISRIAHCSSGIEPYFSLVYGSNILWKGQDAENTTFFVDCPRPLRDELVRKHGEKNTEAILLEIYESNQTSKNPNENTRKKLEKLGIDTNLYRTASEITPEAHVKMLAVWQENSTNSVSKTINLPTEATLEDIKRVFRLAWKLNCKAVTVYRDGSKSVQVLSTKKMLKKEPVGVEKNGLHPVPRPRVMPGQTYQIKTGHGNEYITVNSSNDKNSPFEIFSILGKSGGCDAAFLEAVSRLSSLALRSGISKDEIASQLEGIICCPVWDNGRKITSPVDAIAYVLRGTLIAENAKKESSVFLERAKLCKFCGGQIVFQSGCEVCMICGVGKCE